jgi:hypothetical protein
MIFEKDLERLDGLEPEQKFCLVERMTRERLEESRFRSGPDEPDVTTSTTMPLPY